MTKTKISQKMYEPVKNGLGKRLTSIKTDNSMRKKILIGCGVLLGIGFLIGIILIILYGTSK